MLDTYFTIRIMSDINYFNLISTEDTSYLESVEMNPISRKVLIVYGVEGMVLYKVSMISVVCFSLMFTHKKYPRLSFGVVLFAFILTAIVALAGLGFLVLYHWPVYI